MANTLTLRTGTELTDALDVRCYGAMIGQIKHTITDVTDAALKCRVVRSASILCVT